MSDIDALLVARIAKSIGTTAGDMLYWTGAGTPVRLPIGSTGQILTVAGGIPTWSGAGSTTPGTQLDYAQITVSANTTATTEATSTAIVTGNSVTYDGTQVKVDFWTPGTQEAGGAGTLTLVVYRDTTVVGQAKVNLNSVATYPVSTPFTVTVLDTPAAGAHTYSVKGFINVGTGTVIAGAGGSGNPLPSFIRVTKA